MRYARDMTKWHTLIVESLFLSKKILGVPNKIETAVAKDHVESKA